MSQTQWFYASVHLVPLSGTIVTLCGCTVNRCPTTGMAFDALYIRDHYCSIRPSILFKVCKVILNM
jgi:hypothetical protein